MKTNNDGTVEHRVVDDEAKLLREQSSPEVIFFSLQNKNMLTSRAYMMKWYFDSRIGDCGVIPYGDCLLNGNNFKIYGQCQRYCPELFMEVTSDERIKV